MPSLLDNVHLQVKDMDIRHIEGVSGHMSIKDAWARMKDENIKTLPVTRGEKLEADHYRRYCYVIYGSVR